MIWHYYTAPTVKVLQEGTNYKDLYKSLQVSKKYA